MCGGIKPNPDGYDKRVIIALKVILVLFCAGGVLGAVAGWISNTRVSNGVDRFLIDMSDYSDNSTTVVNALSVIFAVFAVFACKRVNADACLQNDLVGLYRSFYLYNQQKNATLNSIIADAKQVINASSLRTISAVNTANNMELGREVVLNIGFILAGLAVVFGLWGVVKNSPFGMKSLAVLGESCSAH